MSLPTGLAAAGAGAKPSTRAARHTAAAVHTILLMRLSVVIEFLIRSKASVLFEKDRVRGMHD
jgi:hypothetical protein